MGRFPSLVSTNSDGATSLAVTAPHRIYSASIWPGRAIGLTSYQAAPFEKSRQRQASSARAPCLPSSAGGRRAGRRRGRRQVGDHVESRCEYSRPSAFIVPAPPWGLVCFPPAPPPLLIT